MTMRRTIGYRLLLLGVLTLSIPAVGEAQSPDLAPSPGPPLASEPPTESADQPVPSAPGTQAAGPSSAGTYWSWGRILTIPFWLPAQALLYSFALVFDLIALPENLVEWGLGGKPCWYAMTHIITRSPSQCAAPSPPAGEQSS